MHDSKETDKNSHKWEIAENKVSSCVFLQILDELEIDLDNMELGDIDTTDVNLDDEFLDD